MDWWGVAIVAVFLVVVGIDIWCKLTGREMLTQFIRREGARFPITIAVPCIMLGMFLMHFFGHGLCG
jgi:hypothetical protein